MPQTDVFGQLLAEIFLNFEASTQVEPGKTHKTFASLLTLFLKESEENKKRLALLSNELPKRGTAVLEECELGASALMKQRITRLQAHSRFFFETLEKYLASARLRTLSQSKRLRTQSSMADQRLRQLLFETNGEVEKHFRRSDALAGKEIREHEEDCLRRAVSRQWKHFLGRLEADSMSLLSIRNLKIGSDSFQLCSKLIADAVLDSGVPSRVARIALVKVPHSAKSPPHRSKVPRCRVTLCKTLEEFSSEWETLLRGSIGLLSASPDNVRDCDCFSGPCVRHNAIVHEDGCRLPVSQIRGFKEATIADGTRIFSGSVQRVLHRPSTTLLTSGALGWMGPLAMNGMALSSCPCMLCSTTEGASQQSGVVCAFGHRISRSSAQLYYCLEARVATMSIVEPPTPTNTSASASVSRTINDFFVRFYSKEERFSPWVDGSVPCAVLGKDGRHRMPMKAPKLSLSQTQARTFQVLASFPDVLLVQFDTPSGESVTYHLVPACIHHLAETPQFNLLESVAVDAVADWNTHYPPGLVLRGVVTALFGILPGESSIEVVGSRVVPLSELAIRELLVLNMYRGVVEDMHVPTATALLRQVEGELHTPVGLWFPLPAHLQMEIVPTKSPDPPSPGDCYAMVFQCGPSLPDAVLAPPYEERAVHGLCIWRSCTNSSLWASNPHSMDGAVISGKKRSEDVPLHLLCEPHATMALSMKHADVVRYISGPVEKVLKSYQPGHKSSKKSKDTHPIKRLLGDSSLLSELSNGKLQSTVQAFTRRTAKDASAHKANQRQKTAKQQIQVLNKQKEKLKIELGLCQRVARVESAVTKELKAMSEMGVYPSDQLAAIRREYRSLDLQRNTMEKKTAAECEPDQLLAAEIELELEFCKRKLQILRRGRETAIRRIDQGT